MSKNKIGLWSVEVQDEDSLSHFVQFTEEKAYQEAVDFLVETGTWEAIMDEESVPDHPLSALEMMQDRAKYGCAFDFSVSWQELELPETPEQRFMEEFHKEVVALKDNVAKLADDTNLCFSTLERLSFADRRIAYINVLVKWNDLCKKHFPEAAEEKSE